MGSSLSMPTAVILFSAWAGMLLNLNGLNFTLSDLSDREKGERKEIGNSLHLHSFLCEKKGTVILRRVSWLEVSAILRILSVVTSLGITAVVAPDDLYELLGRILETLLHLKVPKVECLEFSIWFVPVFKKPLLWSLC